jgi:hypothetical protein
LDVTQQAVGDAGLEVLVKLAKTCLEDLRCDGSAPSTAALLLDILSRFSTSHLFTCDWPKMDIGKLREKENPQNWKQVMQQFETLQPKFPKKLNPDNEVNQILSLVSLCLRIVRESSISFRAVLGFWNVLDVSNHLKHIV